MTDTSVRKQQREPEKDTATDHPHLDGMFVKPAESRCALSEQTADHTDELASDSR